MNRIRELRIERGYTQSDLAKIIGVNQTAIGKYERGELEPNINTLIMLAHIFDVSVDFLVENTDDFGQVLLKADVPSISKEEQEIVATFRALPRELQVQVQAYVSALGELTAENKKYKTQWK